MFLKGFRRRPGKIKTQNRKVFLTKLKDFGSRLAASNLAKRVIIIFIIFLILGMIVYSIYFFYIFNSTNFDQYEGVEFEQLDWDGQSRINLLFIGGDVQDNGYEFIDYLSIVQIDPPNNNVKVFDINTFFATYFKSESEYITFRNILAVENVYPDKGGFQNLILSAQNFSAIKIDGYVYVTKQGFEKIFGSEKSIEVELNTQLEDTNLPFQLDKGKHQLPFGNLVGYLAADGSGENAKMQRQNEFFSKFFSEFGFIKYLIHFEENLNVAQHNVYTNFTNWDFIKLLYFFRQGDVNFETGYTRSNLGYIKYTTAGQVWVPVYKDIDVDLQEIFLNNDVKLEQARIDVLNGSGRSKLASVRARWLRNKGIRVVLVGNSPEELDQTKVYVEEPELYLNTIKEIEDSFFGDVEIIKQRYQGRSVGDIVVVLGKNEISY